METTGPTGNLFSEDITRRAARHACEAYGGRGAFEGRTVNQYWLAGELLGFVAYENDEAFVVFRGTDTGRNFGNWLFSNALAYRLPFAVTDPAVEVSAAVSSTRHQGGQLLSLLPGGVHQGFFRGFSWLWYGSDVCAESTPSGGLWATVGTYALPPLLYCLLLWFKVNQWEAATYALGLLVVQMALGRGVVEGLFKLAGKPKQDGEPLVAHSEKLAQCREVYFVGHSLGGAIAALAFTAYQFSRVGRAAENAYLLMLGAPPIGDATFQRAFANHHRGKYRSIADRGDLVPRLPPDLSAVRQGFRTCLSGHLVRRRPGLSAVQQGRRMCLNALEGFLLGAIVTPVGYAGWNLYTLLYGLRDEAPCDEFVIERVGDSGAFTSANHFNYFPDYPLCAKRRRH